MKLRNLSNNLNSQNIDFEIIRHDKPIKSKNDALGYFKIEETAPTLIIKADSQYFALIVSGERNKVNFDLLKTLTGCRKVEMANKQELFDNFNLEPGQVPLVGHNLPCILDNKLFYYDYVFGGTGDLYHTLKINPNHLEKVNKVIFRFD